MTLRDLPTLRSPDGAVASEAKPRCDAPANRRHRCRNSAFWAVSIAGGPPKWKCGVHLMRLPASGVEVVARADGKPLNAPRGDREEMH